MTWSGTTTQPRRSYHRHLSSLNHQRVRRIWILWVQIKIQNISKQTTKTSTTLIPSFIQDKKVIFNFNWTIPILEGTHITNSSKYRPICRYNRLNLQDTQTRWIVDKDHHITTTIFNRQVQLVTSSHWHQTRATPSWYKSGAKMSFRCSMVQRYTCSRAIQMDCPARIIWGCRLQLEIKDSTWALKEKRLKHRDRTKESKSKCKANKDNSAVRSKAREKTWSDKSLINHKTRRKMVCCRFFLIILINTHRAFKML